MRIDGTAPGYDPDVLDEAIDALVPRGAKPDYVAITQHEYLARLSSLRRKLFGVRHRAEAWTTVVRDARVDLERLMERARRAGGREPELAATLPEAIRANIRTGISFTTADLRIENEFESLLFSIRATLDVLTRVISAHNPGETDRRSYRDLWKRLSVVVPDSELTRCIDRAMKGWAEELRERRDAAGHYVALSACSSVRVERVGGEGANETVTFLGIPKDLPKSSVSVWHHVTPPVWEGVRSESRSATINGTTIEEQHQLRDSMGRVILEHIGSLPSPPELIDADAYVTDLLAAFFHHVGEVLNCLRREPRILAEERPRAKDGKEG